MVTLMKQLPPPEGVDFMGLEKEGFSVFPGVKSVLQIPLVNNKFNIGLDGTSKEVKELKKTFENYFGVQFDTPEGQEFLSNYEIVIDHDITAYDKNNIKDIFDLHVLKVNGGMGLVASSQEDIENVAINTFKFLLVDESHEVSERVKDKQLRAKAITKLSELYESNTDRIVLLAKYMFNITSGIATKDVAFDKLDEYINKGTNAAKTFLEVCQKDPKYLYTVVKVKEAIFRNIIRYNEGKFYLHATNTPLGRNEEEVIKFCLNPANSDIVGSGMDDDSPTSISAQLKQYI